MKKTIEERLKAKGITEKSKFHNYDYLYKSIIEIMQDYEKELEEKEKIIETHKWNIEQVNKMLKE